ncbi:MAG: OadG family transporter subunit [Oscillospiraceae bacterium]
MELALILTILGMGTVLILLYIINLIIRLMGKIFAEKKVPALPTEADFAAVESAVSEDEDELIAVTAYLGSSAASGLTVRPFAAPACAWAAASRAENTQH